MNEKSQAAGHRSSGLLIALVRTLVLIASFFALITVAVPIPASAASVSQKSQPPSWSTFHDPIYGFSLTYPTTWTLTSERDGSHITLLDPATSTTLSPIVIMQKETANAILKHGLPAQATAVQTRVVANHQAIDYVVPAVLKSKIKVHNLMNTTLLFSHLTRQVIVPVAVVTGTTNVYTFLLTQPTSTTGQISTAEQNDQHIFETILNSFKLPAKVTSAQAIASANTSDCDRVCWADNNWSYNYYDDSSSGYYCDSQGYNSNLQCSDGNNYSAQVPEGSGDLYQPEFECAEFVTRALTQDGLIPGLNNGGVNGSFPVSNQSSYGSYQANNGVTYNLLGVPDLDRFLSIPSWGTDLKSNISQAQPGDVVIFYANGSPDHTMITTSTGFLNNGVWDVYLDGHNAAAYHNLLSSWVNYNGYTFRIVHPNGGGGSSGGSGGSGSGAMIASASTVDVKYADGSQDLIAVGSDGRMWHNWASASGNWIGWNWWSTGTSFANATPTLVTHADGSMDLIAVGKDGRMWHRWATASGSWIDWNWWSNSTPFAAASPTLVKYADGSMDLIAVGSDGRMWHRWATASGSWIDWNWWSNSTPFAAASPTLVTYLSGDIDLIAVGSDGHMWHRWATASGSWIDWNWFGSTASFE